MVQELLSRVRSKTAYIIFLILSVSGTLVQAQSVLLPGDVVIVSVNSSNDSFDFIPLVDLEAGTEIWFKTGAWNADEFVVEDGEELHVQIDKPIEAGTNVHINNQQDERLTTIGNLSFSGTGDRIFVLQEEEETGRVIFGIGWGSVDIWDEDSESGSKIPSSISAENNTLITLGDAENYQYYLRNGASGTAGMLSAFVTDPAKWRGQNRVEYPPFGTTFRLLKPPVLLFDESVSTIRESEAIILNVAIYEHDGSRLTVPARFLERFSTADTSDLSGFTTYDFNFTGLMGDAVYSVEIPVKDNDGYQGMKNAYFELGIPSQGTLGDFVSHVAFIQDDEEPEVSIDRVLIGQSTETDFIEIRNQERVPVSLTGWKLESKDFSYEFGREATLDPVGSFRLVHPTVRNDNVQKSWPVKKTDTIRLISLQGNIVSEWSSQMTNVSRRLSNEIEARSLTIQNKSTNTVETISDAATVFLTKVESNSYQPETGWYATKKAPGSQQSLYFWSVEAGAFVKVEETSQNVEEQVLIIYKDADALRSDSTLADSVLNPKPAELSSVLNVSLSGIDSDENEAINGKEGFNLLLNNTGYDIPVHHFIQSLNEQLQRELIYPYIYSFRESALSWNNVEVLSSGGYIPDGAAFFVRVDSVLEQTSLRYVLPQSPVVTTTQFDAEPEGQFDLIISSDSINSKVTIRLFEKEADIPREILNPALLPELMKLGGIPIQFGISMLSNWHSEVNIPIVDDQRFVFPLGFESQSSGDLKILIDKWKGIPAGWTVMLEDTFSGKIYDLREGWELDFSYYSEKRNTEEELRLDQSTDLEQTIDERFQLILMSSGYEHNETAVPDDITLVQNYPNPFNPTTTIAFNLPESMRVKLSVFNVVGQPIAVLADGMLGEGDHSYEWDATGLPSGMYIYQLEVGTKVLTRKMTLVK